MHYTNEWDARLAWASFPAFRHWPERMGGPPVFTRTGFVNVVAPAFADHLRRNVEMLRSIGIDTCVLSPADLKRLEPAVNVDDIGAAAHEPESGYANPVDTVQGFGRRLREMGGEVRQWTPVTRVVREGSRVLGAETPTGRIDAAAVVIAAGAWSVRLCREMGLPLPARPKAIDTVLVTRPSDMPDPHLIIIDNILGTYMRPESGILTLVGVPCQEWDIDPDSLGTGLPPEAAATGAHLLMHRFPPLARATLARGYRAFDGYSHDRHAILGEVDGVDGLYLATAFSGSGFKIAPAVGACMAELIVDGGAKTVEIGPFNLRRFALGRRVETPHPYATRPDHLDPAASPPR